MRNDSAAFHDYYKKFYQECFFPYIKKHGIKTVIQSGDMFDRRKFINFNTLYKARQYFFSEFNNEDDPIDLIVYIGNHDSYHKNSIEINSPELLLREYKNIKVITKPEIYQLGQIYVDIIPWICDDNKQQIEEFISKSDRTVCFGHFEINGFEMDRGVVCNSGIDRSYLNKYEMVISGHFHHRSTDGHIFYVGSPGAITWADYGDKRGFHIFDTETKELEFIENPFHMFHKIVYDERIETLDTISKKDFSILTNTMVKIVVFNKENPILFDHFMDAVYKASPLDVKIMEDFTDISEQIENDVIDQTDSTIDILDKTVDSIEIGLDKDKMKYILRNVYNEALEKTNDQFS